VLLAWAPDDRFFPISYAQRLERTIPDATLEQVEGAKTFVPLDQPERLAELIAGFVASNRAAPTMTA
jgi:pimeloyl-ACP methyl ester carboxylesterase